MARFSRRTGWPRNANALSELLAEKKAAKTAIADLTESNPTRCEFEYLSRPWIAEALARAASSSYEPDPKGFLAAREAVSAYYAARGASVSPDRIFLTSGTSEAYSFLLRLLAEPQDAVAVPVPGYPLFDYVLGLNDCVPSPYRSAFADGEWRIVEGSLDEAAAEHPRAIVVVNPNNPTGRYVSDGEREILVRACRRADAALVSDEVFLDYATRPGGMKRTLAGTKDVLTFTLSGISKVLGLPQMKLSWIAVSGPDAAVKDAVARLEVIADTYLSVSTPVQRALPAWLQHATGVKEEIGERVRANAAVAARHGMLPSEGGWYAVLERPGKDDEAEALRLLKEKNVFIHPGYFFDFAENGRLVASLLPPPSVFRKSMEAMG